MAHNKIIDSAYVQLLETTILRLAAVIRGLCKGKEGIPNKELSVYVAGMKRKVNPLDVYTKALDLVQYRSQGEAVRDDDTVKKCKFTWTEVLCPGTPETINVAAVRVVKKDKK